MTRLGRIETADDTRISGWAFDTDADGCLVELMLDGRPFVSVHADLARPDVAREYGHERSGFVFRIGTALADLIPSGSKVSARFATGEPLGLQSGLASIGRATPDLFTRLARGWRVSPKSGDAYWPIGNSTTWTTSLGPTYQRAREVFTSELGRDLFAAYGSLLGLVREGRFLAHDDDFDAAFLSTGTTVETVAEDLVGVAKRLLDLGLDVRLLNQGSFHLKLAGTGPILDIFVFARVDERMLAYQVFRPVPSGALDPTGEIVHDGVSYAAPRDTDAVLTAIYGSRWRIPDPHFQWRPDAETAETMAKLQRAIAAARAQVGI
jgi:hypothetical protein